MSFILRKTEVLPREKKKKKEKKQTSNKYEKTNKQNEPQQVTSYPLPHAFVENTIRHNIAQMTSTSKAYIPCLLVIIIK